MKNGLLWCVLAVSALSLNVHAQWQWIDKDGRKVFSDSAPPPDVPPKNILKQPGARGVAPGPVADAASAASSPAPGLARPPASAASRPTSAAERELLERKKQQEAAQEAARKASEAAVNERRASACAGVRNTLAQINSGVRVARANAKGEREFLDEAGLAAERKRLQDILSNDCKGP